MAYWGEALAYNQPLWCNENLDKARAALAGWRQRAPARQAKAPTAREKGYLDAVERLFGDGDKPARDRAYADRMARAAARSFRTTTRRRRSTRWRCWRRFPSASATRRCR